MLHFGETVTFRNLTSVLCPFYFDHYISFRCSGPSLGPKAFGICVWPYQASSSVVLYLVLEIASLTKPEECQYSQADWPAKVWEPPVSATSLPCPTTRGTGSCSDAPMFYKGIRDLNSPYLHLTHWDISQGLKCLYRLVVPQRGFSP